MSDITTDTVVSETGVATEGSEGLVEDTSTPSTEEFAPEPSSESAEATSVEEYIFELEGIGGITLDEAQKGYLRQADYTRKTQELAQQRQQLQQAQALAAALERDPASTLQVLAETFGVNLAPQAPQDPYADLDPDEARIARLEAQLQENLEAQQRRDAEARIDAELASLHEQYGDFDESALFTTAVERGLTLEAAYRFNEFERLNALLQEQKQKELEDSKRVESKRKAQAVHSTASGRSSSGQTSTTEKPASFRDAFLMAKRELGLG